jgi:hypothetical protein
VIDFMNFRHKDMGQNTKFSKNYLWFAGQELPKVAKTYLSRVDIELINEQIKLLLRSGCSWNHFDEDTLPLLNTFH